MAEKKTVDEFEEVEVRREPSGWSFLNYLRSIAKFKWWVIGFSVAGAVAGYLGFRLGLNPMKKTLDATFTYELAGENDGTGTIRFIDGSSFNSFDLTNRENLEALKDSNEKYSGVNIDRIVDQNGIEILETETVVTTVMSADGKTRREVTTKIYSVTAKASMFPSDTLGKEFVYDLVVFPKTLSTKAISNYNAVSYFYDNFSSLSFEKQISQLESQYDSLNTVYDDLIEKFGSSVTASADNKKLYELQNQFISSYYTSGTQTFVKELSGLIDVNKYVNYTIGKEDEKINELHAQCRSYIENIKDDEQALQVYNDSLAALTTASTYITNDTEYTEELIKLNTKINELKAEKNSLAKELNNNGYFIDTDPMSPTYNQYVFNPAYEDSAIYRLTTKTQAWVDGCQAFRNKINAYKEKLSADRETATQTYRYCYSQYQNRVNVQNGGYVQLSGEIPSVIGIPVGLLVGFLVSSLVCFTLYIYRKPKKDNPEEE